MTPSGIWLFREPEAARWSHLMPSDSRAQLPSTQFAKLCSSIWDQGNVALKSEIATLVTDNIVNADVKAFAANKDYLNAFIVALASKWSVNEPIVISTADAEGLTKYFAAKAKDLLDKGVKIEQVNGIKTLFSVSPADGSYKVNFGEEEFMNYFKEFLRPQLVEMLF